MKYDVEFSVGNTLIGVVTLEAKTPEEASNKAAADIKIKVKKNYEQT